MDRRSFLRTVAVSVGLIAAGKTVAAPLVKRKDQEIILSCLHYYWIDCPQCTILNDGRIRKEINGGVGVGRKTPKEQADKWVRNLIPSVERGYKRISVSFSADLYGKESRFQTVDVQV